MEFRVGEMRFIFLYNFLRLVHPPRSITTA